MAIALFYSPGTGAGTPALFGFQVESGPRSEIMYDFLAGAVFMLLTALVEAFLGVSAERKSLEDIAMPLSAE